MTENELALEQLIGHLREDRHTRLGLHRITHPVGSCECSACDQLRVVTFGIEAIREMQAELAAREEAELTPRRLVPVTYFLGKSAQQWCEEHHRIEEELRIVETSWEFEGGKRIIAERDDLRRQLAAAQGLVGRLSAERDAALDAAEREGKEGRTARHKLRATEEAMDVAEGKVERLEEERNKYDGHKSRLLQPVMETAISRAWLARKKEEG